MTTPSLSVLIVNFNSTSILEECLRSLAASSIADELEVIVVDNASDDFSVDAMERAHPSVTFLPQGTNTTYTGGNNIAFERATAELILLLNPDTRVEPEALQRAIGHMRADQDLSAMSAYLIGPDGELQRYYRRLPRFGDLPVMLFEPIFRTTRRGRRFLMLGEPFDKPTPVEDPPGAFLLVRRSALGGRLLDGGYFNFVSDLELCDRLGRSGKIVVFPDVRCHHQRAGAGVGTRDPVARLRLYHDFTWGLLRHFATRLRPTQRVAFHVLLALYWVTRVGRLALEHPTVLFRAMATVYRATSGGPPHY